MPQSHKRDTLIASQEGRDKIWEAVAKSDWPIRDERWCEAAEEVMKKSTSLPTWERFYYARKRIYKTTFKAFCTVLKLNPETITQGTPIEDIERPKHSYHQAQYLSDDETLTFGPIQTTWLVKDGTGEFSYERENIVCHYENKALKLPPNLQNEVENVQKDQNKNREKGKGPFFFNGPRYYFDRFIITRTEREERPQLELWFGPSTYYTYLATNQQLHEKKFRKQYPINSWEQPPKFFSNAFAIYLCVITDDNYLILTQRSQNVGSRPGEFNISANEALSRDFDNVGNKPDIYGCAIRGLSEELALDQRATDINFLSFGVDTLLGHWALLGFTKTQKTKHDLIVARSQGVRDKWENSRIAFVPFNLDEVISYILNANRPWAPGAIACIYHTLVAEFGREACDEALRKASTT